MSGRHRQSVHRRDGTWVWAVPVAATSPRAHASRPFTMACPTPWAPWPWRRLMHLVAIFNRRHAMDKCRDPGSNWGPSDLQSDALPTELSRQLSSTCCRKSAVMLQPPTPLHLLQLPLSSDARCPLPWTISSSLALTCLPSLAPGSPHGADVCRSEQTVAESPQP